MFLVLLTSLIFLAVACSDQQKESSAGQQQSAPSPSNEKFNTNKKNKIETNKADDLSSPSHEEFKRIINSFGWWNTDYNINRQFLNLKTNKEQLKKLIAYFESDLNFPADQNIESFFNAKNVDLTSLNFSQIDTYWEKVAVYLAKIHTYLGELVKKMNGLDKEFRYDFTVDRYCNAFFYKTRISSFLSI